MVLKTINYFLLAIDAVINYLKTKVGKLTTKILAVFQIYRYKFQFGCMIRDSNCFPAVTKWGDLKVFKKHIISMCLCWDLHW